MERLSAEMQTWLRKVMQDYVENASAWMTYNALEVSLRDALRHDDETDNEDVDAVIAEIMDIIESIIESVETPFAEPQELDKDLVEEVRTLLVNGTADEMTDTVEDVAQVLQGYLTCARWITVDTMRMTFISVLDSHECANYKNLSMLMEWCHERGL
jgi:5'-3' exonuclease